jgi:predicted Zn-dependent protease with MMP-like domain
MRLSPEQFDALAFEEAEAVLAQLPPDLRAEAETVLLAVEDRRPADQRQPGTMTLGLYEGVPLVERHADTVLLTPDRVTLYRLPLLSLARTEPELRRQVRKTLIHELGHFFGFDEEELRRRGWG